VNPHRKSLVQILQKTGADEKIIPVMTWDKQNKLGNRPDKGAKEELAARAKEWGVGPPQLREKIAGLFNRADRYITLPTDTLAKIDFARLLQLHLNS
jgi:hypothetical protein